MISRIVSVVASPSLAVLVSCLISLAGSMQVSADPGEITREAKIQGGLIRYVDGVVGDDQGGANNCSAQASPCLTITRAIDASAAADTIQIADATYTESLTIVHTLTLSGESEQGTIIQAHPQPFEASNRVVTIAGSFQVAIADLTIRHGGVDSGAGIFLDGAVALTLDRVTLYRNQAASAGGGIRATQAGCALTIRNSNFIENESQSNQGGGIHTQNCSIDIATTSFIDNSASSGGGISIVDGVGTPQFDRVTFLGNRARNLGGGLYNFRSTTAIANSVFRGNVAQSEGGGGGNGGGLFNNSQGSEAILVNVLISGNTSGSGGAGIGVQVAGSTLSLTNVTITGNRAGGVGSGINRIYSGEIRNTIIWNNGTGTASSSISQFGISSIDLQSNLIQGFSSSDLGGNGNLDGTNAANDPLFTFSASPAGAPTTGGDYRPREYSPVINAGDNASIAGYNQDLDGFARIVEGVVDLGPYEFGNDFLFRDRFEF